MTVVVYPRHKVYGYFAPAMYFSGIKKEEAIKEARQKSGLGRFDCWEFL